MEINVMTVKYSIFGNYDFVDNTPENVSKLYESFGKEGFMPNMVTLLKIEQPQNKVDQLYRPQLVNKSMPCTITILPERVDIETSEGIELEKILDYFTRIIDSFNLKINRIALNKTSIIANLTKDEQEKLNEKLTPPENCCGEQELIEYVSHRVVRKNNDYLDEKINIGRNLTSATTSTNGETVIDKVQVDTDINTRGENTKERFEINHCEHFFEFAIECDQEILENMVRVINESKN